jgi:hypothetical protein
MIEFMFDTANIDAINRLVDTCPNAMAAGAHSITATPSVLDDAFRYPRTRFRGGASGRGESLELRG